MHPFVQHCSMQGVLKYLMNQRSICPEKLRIDSNGAKTFMLPEHVARCICIAGQPVKLQIKMDISILLISRRSM